MKWWTTRDNSLQAAYNHCRQIQKHFGTSYYFATRFFEPSIRNGVHALYAFVRYPDQWVDDSSHLAKAEVRQLLNRYVADLLRALDGETVDSPVLTAFADTVVKYQIPIEYICEFLDAMNMDLERSRYHTFEELKSYARGSASVVGLMMLCLFGVCREPLTRYAELMGLAMQLTNFLRDVKEDFLRGRIYLPQEELQEHSLTESDIAQGVVDQRWRTFMQFQIERARKAYREAECGIPLLPKHAQYPVLLGSRLYAAILTEIEQADYDVYSARVRTSGWTKLSIAWRCKQIAKSLPS